MHRILLLSSAAIALSGCSFLSGSSHSGNGAYSHPQSNAYSHNCGAVNCAPGSSYSVSNAAPSYGHQANHGYGAPQQPSPHAYGSQVKNHAAHGPQTYGHQAHQGQAYGHPPQLRGPYGHAPRRGYKYGTLGAVAYDLDSDIYGIQGRLGYQSANYIGAEVEGSFGVISDKETVGATELKAGVNYSLGAFARGVVPLGERFNIFARGGYHVTEIDGSATDATGTVEVSETTDGFAYGAGAEFALTPRDSLRLDYTRYDVGPGETDSVAVSYARKF